jgi:hypothetical protein
MTSIPGGASDRQLLEWAAKAGGIELAEWTGPDDSMVPNRFWSPTLKCYWSSLAEGGDAIHLQAQLKMNVKYSSSDVRIVVDSGISVHEPFGDNRLHATLRVVTRAAAEIGKAMK